MNFDKDYYKILGVLDDAEDIVIKAAYRALAQKYHPDKFQGSAKTAKDRMQEINEAYSVLSDPEERKKYDGSRKKQEYEQWLMLLKSAQEEKLEYDHLYLQIELKNTATYRKTMEKIFWSRKIKKQENDIEYYNQIHLFIDNK